MEHLGTAYLKTAHLILRRFMVEDSGAMFANWAGDPAVTKFLVWPTHDSVEASRSILEDWVVKYERADYYCWGISLKGSGILIGSIEAKIKDNDKGIVSVGYCIGKEWWGQGYVAEALQALVRFFFEEVGANRIEASHDPRNPNSGKVMQKAGLRYEGTLREWQRGNLGVADAAFYAILASDYFRKSPVAKKAGAVVYRQATLADIEAVTEILCELYQMEEAELRAENEIWMRDGRQRFVLAEDKAGSQDKPVAIAHFSLRREYVNGARFELEDGGCGFLEAIYVRPEYRLRGIASELVRQGEQWAREHGFKEFASDCLLHNTESYLFHLRLGFSETERCIFFRKEL